MPAELRISLGQCSDKGRKPTNQDFHGALIPDEPLLNLKGIAVVIADGISSSDVSHIASESAVKSFLTDYYCTSESWSVKTSAQRVLAATNAWLHSQTRRSQYAYDKDKGYVCTLSALVIKSTTAHIFHVGDCRVYRLAGNTLEQLTDDHRVIVSSEQTYLGRALGINPQIEIDYRAVPIEKGDVFLLATDGVYEHVSGRLMATAVRDHAADLDDAARLIVDEALAARQPGQSHGPDRTDRRRAQQRGERGFSTVIRTAAAAAAGGQGYLRRLPDRQGASREPAAAISISPSIPIRTRWSGSRFRRSTCATIRPI